MPKRLVRLLIVVCMLAITVCLLTATVSAAESGTCGDDLIWTLDDTGTLTISGTGNMDDWDWWASPFFPYRSSINTVVICDGVTTIGEFAFRECSGLTSITIPDSVTSIGKSSFFGCSGLTSIITPDSVTTIGDDAFFRCSGLTSITLPDSVTSIGNFVFCYCWGLTSITIPDSITTIGHYAFYDCDALTNITIPDGVTTIGEYAFSDCSGLTSITIPDSVTTIGDGAFSYCSGLTSITIPDSVTSIGSFTFQYCTNLKNVTIPGSVKNTGEQVFYNCTRLTSVTLSDGVTYIGTSAFRYCDKLTSVTFPETLTSIDEHAFENCTNLSDVYYYGNESEWNDISIAVGNECITDAKVNYIVWKVTLDKEELSLIINSSDNTYDLTETVYSEIEEGKAVTWDSDNEKVATVDKNGKVTAVGNGVAVITATTVYGGYTASCRVTVTTAVEGVTLDRETAAIYIDETLDLTATVSPELASDKSVTWKSDNQDVATVDQNGRVTPINRGMAVITVTTEDGSYTAECTVTVMLRTEITSLTGSYNSENTLTVSLSAENVHDNTTVYLAAYDSDGRLVSIQKLTVSQNPVLIFINEPGIRTIKAFVWDEFMAPLCECGFANIG